MKNDALTTHFKMLDYHKKLLFNSQNEEQQETLKKIIENEKEREKSLYIKRVI